MDRRKARDTAAAFTRQLSGKPKSPVFYIRLGNALNRSGFPRRALAAYERALAQTPESRTALRNRGLTLFRLGRTDDAARVLRRVVDLAPGDGRARFELGALRYRQGRLKRAAAHLEKATTLRPDCGSAWQKLGDALKLMGEAGRALEAYRQAAKRMPDCPAVFYSLGATLNALKRGDEAREHLSRALVLDPANASARHLLCALEARTPPCAPTGYVRRLFDRYALRFDRQMRGPLAYTVPDALARELAARRGGRRIYPRGLDLGCGTGLSGEALRPWTRRLTGVDISAAMLAEARRKGIYNRLVCREIVAWLRQCRQTYDLVTAADVLIYIGDLQPLFAAVRPRLATGGRFYFSTETTRHHPFRLRRTGRFAHHRGYITDLAAACGFKVEKRRSLVIRKEHDRLIHGDLFIFGLNNHFQSHGPAHADGSQ